MGAIEFLGDGQQYVIAGTHPKTMAPYRWEHAGRTGGVELLEASLDRLPNLSDSVLRERLVPMIQLFAQKRGLQASSATSSAPARTGDQESLRAPSLEMLRAIVSHIPNPGRDWDYFVRMAAAVRAAAGPDGEREGFQIFDEWSAKLEGLYDANLTLDRWQSVEPPNAIGFDYLVSRARLGGYDNAREEFDADGEAPPAIIALPRKASESPRWWALLHGHSCLSYPA